MRINVENPGRCKYRPEFSSPHGGDMKLQTIVSGMTELLGKPYPQIRQKGIGN